MLKLSKGIEVRLNKLIITKASMKTDYINVIKCTKKLNTPFNQTQHLHAYSNVLF